MQLKKLDDDFIKYGLFSSINSLKNTDVKVDYTSLQADLDNLAASFCLCQDSHALNEEIPDAEYSPPKAEIQLSNQSTRATRIGELTFMKEVKSLIESVSIFNSPTETIFYGNKKGKDRINASKRRSKYIGVCK